MRSSLRGLCDQAFCKDLRVGRRVGLGLDLCAGHDIEAVDAVVLVIGGLGGRIALALLGHDMDQNRALVGVAHILEDRDQRVEVVAVDRADVVEAQLLEPGAALPDVAGIFLHARGAPLPGLGQALGQLLADFAQVQIGAARCDAGEVVRQRARRRGDRHVVVVEDDDQAAVHGAGVVDRLVGHAGGHCAVADDGDHVVVATVDVAGDGHAETGGNRRRGVRRSEGIVGALRAPGEAGQAAPLAEGADALAATGEDLVRVGLVADVPDQPVARGVEHPVQRHRQLDDAQAGAEVAARYRDGVDRFQAQLVGDLAQVRLGQLAQVFGRGDAVEEGCFALRRHVSLPHFTGAGPAAGRG